MGHVHFWPINRKTMLCFIFLPVIQKQLHLYLISTVDNPDGFTQVFLSGLCMNTFIFTYITLVNLYSNLLLHLLNTT